MSGENINVTTMSERLSDNVFAAFGWTRVGPKNQNWTCVKSEHVNDKNSPRTHHPADVVMVYHDPFTGRVQPVLFDLKSYSASSITVASIRKTVKSIVMSIDCTSANQDFNTLFPFESNALSVIGALFIYNHDGEFDDGKFCEILDKIKPETLEIEEGLQVICFSPRRIQILANIANHMNVMRGQGKYPDKSHGFFYYPDFNQKRVSKNDSQSASIQSLLGSWLIYGYRGPGDSTDGMNCASIYYADQGESPEEFLYLIDYIFKYQIVSRFTSIKIWLVCAVAEASSHFERAKKKYIKEYEHIPEFAKRLDGVNCNSIEVIVTTYKDVEIGLEIR